MAPKITVVMHAKMKTNKPRRIIQKGKITGSWMALARDSNGRSNPKIRGRSAVSVGKVISAFVSRS